VRILAIDPGARRIGVAISDPTGTLAQPLETIERGGPRSTAHLDRVAALVREHGVERVVIGLPLHMDGSAGAEADAARRLGAQIAERTGVPVDYQDERWTTREAERTLRALGTKGRKLRAKSDRVAAALVLRTWLDRHPT
jgi:putative Holliday junction resolvase